MLPGSFLEMFDAGKIRNSDRFLLAVSGGLDSVVLVHLFSNCNHDFAIAHANFQLRGDDSDKDEEFTSSLAQNFGVPFYSKRFDTESIAEKEGVSIQMAARSLRYDWLKGIQNSDGYDFLVTAHHLNDALETTIMNLSRGTGIAGLRGMKVIHEKIFRPLLYTSRESIEGYARLNEIRWREDSSNASDYYSRNFIRHHIIPDLEKLNPSILETYRTTHRRLLDTESVLLQEIQRRLKSFRQEEGSDIIFHRKAFEDLNLAVTEAILAPYGMNVSQVTDFLACIERNEHSKIFLTGRFSLNLDRDQLIISPAAMDIEPLEIDLANAQYDHFLGRISTRIETGTKPILAGPLQVTFDFDRLHKPLILRKWKEGDRFIPLGMKGKKKVSDLMIDEKIPLNLKQRACVLESAGDIIWVIGLRTAEIAKVTSQTTRRFNIIIDNDKSV